MGVVKLAQTQKNLYMIVDIFYVLTKCRHDGEINLY